MTRPALRLIIGLGNPGAEYAETRHNAGFWFCERLANDIKVSFGKESRYHGWVANAREAGIWLLMPATYMNDSGRAVQALAHFYRIQPAEMLVVHDELDLLPGRAQLRFGGGLGGHNGLKSLTSHLGTQDYWRLRVFLRDVFLLNNRRPTSWQVARLDYWRWFGVEIIEPPAHGG